MRAFKQNEILIVLTTQIALMMVGMSMVSPILPLYAQSFGVSMAQVGLVIAAFASSQVLLAIPAGRLTERFGSRPLLVVGPIMLGIFALAAGLATSFWQLVVFRLLQGLGGLLLVTGGMVVLANMSTTRDRGQIMSTYQAGRLAGSAIGPVIGGFAAQYFGLRAPFFLLAPLAVLAGLWALWRVPKTITNLSRTSQVTANPTKEAGILSVKGLKPLLTDVSFMLICLVIFSHHLIMSGSRNTMLPLLGVDRIGLNEAQLGIMFTVMMVIELGCVFAGGRTADKLGRKLAIIPGFVVTAIGLILFSHSTSYGSILLSSIIFGIGFGFFGPVILVYVADVSPPKSYGIAFGLNRSLGDMGILVGPVLVGWLADIGGFNLPFYFTAVLAVVTALVFGLFAKETVRRERKQQVPPVSQA